MRLLPQVQFVSVAALNRKFLCRCKKPYECALLKVSKKCNSFCCDQLLACFIKCHVSFYQNKPRTSQIKTSLIYNVELYSAFTTSYQYKIKRYFSALFNSGDLLSMVGRKCFTNPVLKMMSLRLGLSSLREHVLLFKYQGRLGKQQQKKCPDMKI